MTTKQGVKLLKTTMNLRHKPALMGVYELRVSRKLVGFKAAFDDGKSLRHVKSFPAASHKDEDLYMAYLLACEYATIYNYH